MKKLLILGSDFGTIDIAKKAKQLGYYVITADNMVTSPTKNISDESWLISTADIDGLIELCKINKINGIIAGASDFNNEKAKVISLKLGLKTPYENPKAELAGNNKRFFKNICKEHNVPVAKDFFIDDNSKLDENEISFPLIVKPIDSSGNRGMSYCNNLDDLKSAIKKARGISRYDDVIVEKELKGPEYAVHYIVKNGEPYLYYFASEHNQPGQKNNMYSLVTTTNAHLKQYLTEVDEGIKNVFRSIGCTNGIAWIECIRDKDGHFYCFEMGYRCGATMLYTFNEKITNFSAIEFIIKEALGENTEVPHIKNVSSQSKSVSYHIFIKKDGKISKIKGLDKIETLSDIIIDLPKKEGTEVTKGRHFGVIRFYASNFDDLVSKIDFINENLEILDEKNENIMIHYTDFETLKKEHQISIEQNEIR